MTATLLAASGTPTAGDVTEPLPWDVPAVPEAPTHLELGSVANSALRSVLAHFASESEPLLHLSETIPGAVVLRTAVDRPVDQRIRVFISGSSVNLGTQVQVLRWLASANGDLLQTDARGWTTGEGGATYQVSQQAVEVPTPATDVVEVVGWLAQQLGVPDGDILQAAKIKRRNWHNWKNGRRPRLESQGQLWALHNSVQALSDMFADGLAPWFKEGGESRRALLASGRHRKLVEQALSEAAVRGELSNDSRREARRKSAAGYYE